MKLCVFALIALSMLLAAPVAHGQSTPINYPSGFGTGSCSSFPSNIWLQGLSACVNVSGTNRNHLVTSATHNGSNTFYETALSIQSFVETITFHFDCSAAPTNCGNGMAAMFICPPASANCNNVQTAGYNYSGFSGGQQSWAQCQQPLVLATDNCWDKPGSGNTGSGLTAGLMNSFALPIQNYNQVTGAAGNFAYTGLYENGNYPSGPQFPQYDMTGAGIFPNSGDEMTMVISYNGALLTETITDNVTSASYTQSWLTDLVGSMGGTTAFPGFGGGTGGAIEDVYLDGWTYYQPAVTGATTPTFSPASETITGSTSVTLTCPGGGVCCISTTAVPVTNGDGATCLVGTKYTGAFNVNASETIFAVAGTNGGADSSVIGAATYTLNTTAPLATSSLPTGNYTFPIKPTLFVATPSSVGTPGTIANTANIYYGTAAVGASCTPSTALAGAADSALTVSSAERVCVNAQLSGLTTSATQNYDYSSGTTPAAAPTASPSSGTFNGTQTVALSSTTPSPVITYCTGTAGTMCTPGTTYTSALAVSSTEEICAFTNASGYTQSTTACFAYYIIPAPVIPATPTATPPGATYSSPQTVTLADSTSGASIFYTNDGSTPDLLSTLYSSPFLVSTNQIIKAAGVSIGVSIINAQTQTFQQCYIGSCAGGGTPGGTGTPSAVAQTLGVASPSLSGAAQRLYLTTSQSNTNVLWYIKPGPLDTAQNLSMAVNAYPSLGYANAAAYEFDLDVYDSAGNYDKLAGTQCNLTNGTVDIWNNAGGGWVHTSIACTSSVFQQNHWNSWVVSAYLDDSTSTACSGTPCVHYLYITINGVQHVLNQTEPSRALPSGFTHNTVFNVQIDGATVSGATTFDEYIDNTNVQFGGPLSAVNTSNYVIGASSNGISGGYLRGGTIH